MTDKVVRIIDKADVPDARMWSVGDMLKDAATWGEENKEYRKAVVIFLDDTEGGYGTFYFQSGMRISEIVSLLRILGIRLEYSVSGIK